MNAHRFDIAGLAVPLFDAARALARLNEIQAELGRRLTAYAGSSENTVLCRAGCSHCCRSGGFFALTLAEALQLRRAVVLLPAAHRETVENGGLTLLEQQREIFASISGLPDRPGRRDELLFSARVSAVTRRGVVCPLLQDEMCSIYEGRPFLCRAYGYAVDAYAVETPRAMVFRSLCVLYEGVSLRDYVRARELKAELTTISRELAGGHDLGRFTLAEAILARETAP